MNRFENKVADEIVNCCSLLKNETIEKIKDQKYIKILFDVAITHVLCSRHNNLNPELLCNVFFMRSGHEINYKIFSEIYSNLEIKSRNYTNLLGFLISQYPNFNHHIIDSIKYEGVFNKDVDISSELDISEEQEIQEIIPVAPIIPPTSNTTAENAKIPKISEPAKTQESTKVIKIKKKSKFENLERKFLEPSTAEKTKIIKYKKNSKNFREMDVKDKETDTRYDYYVIKDTETPNMDSRELITTNPFMNMFFGDIDVDFRKVMFKIYRNTRGRVKDKSNLQEEINFLGEYFFKKLHITRIEDENSKKLANAICYIMKKLQNKIFDSEDPFVISSMLYFKSRLSAFYNYYRK